MLSFKDITQSDIETLDSYFQWQTSRTCDYTTGVVYMWRDYYKAQYALCGDALIIKNTTQAGQVTFTLPTSKGDIAPALRCIEDYTRQNGLPLLFDLITHPQLEILTAHFGPDRMDVHTNRDWADYLYNIDDLVFLTGKKYSGQRNHINKFIKTYPDYKYIEATPDNTGRLRGFMDEFMASQCDLSPLAAQENRMIFDVLDNFEALKAIGGMLEVGGRVIAFALGEVVGDTLYVHIEKADRSYPGSYTVMNRDFAAANCSGEVRYVNREEDLGDPGLRTAKLSYHPAFLLEKHLIEIKP